MKTIYNCHSHVFTNKAVPNNFLRGAIPILGAIPGLTEFLFNPLISWWLGTAMKNILPMQANDVLDRYAAFLNIGNDSTSEEIFNLLRSYYPRDTVFIIFSMDMEFMQAGRSRQTYREQLDELAELKKKYPDLIRPFIMLDPRRGKQEVEDLAKEYIEQKGFAGIKVYPPLGYYPYDARLSGVYDYAQRKKIPVVGHCAGGPVFYRKDLTPDMIDPNAPVKPYETPHPCDHFAHPKCFEIVAQKYPDMKLCLAHAGGGVQMDDYLGASWEVPDRKDRNWYVCVKRMIKKYRNVYTDISGGFDQSRYMPVLKLNMLDSRLSSKILFGSDFYMEVTDMTEREFSIEVRAELGENDFFKIAHDNAEKFLG